MILRVPDYYKDFKCTGSKCRHNCCIGWGIDIDKTSYEHYMSVKSKFGDRLRENMYIDEDGGYTFAMNGERCMFLNEDNLCDIYINLGEESLCGVCSEYPRYAQRYGNVLEKGLGFSCEAAGELIFSHMGKVNFTEMLVHDEAEEEKLDEGLISILAQSRNTLLKILQNREYTINERIINSLDYAEMIQEKINENNFALTDEDFEIKHIQRNTNNGFGKEYIEFFDSLNAMNDEWHEVLENVIKVNYGGDNRYKEIFNSLYSYVNEWEYEQIMVYMIYRYYMKAVYDYSAFDKVRLAAVFLIMVRELDIAVICSRGGFTIENRIENVRRLSSEIEHSQENIDAVYEELMFNEIFSYENIKNMM